MPLCSFPPQRADGEARRSRSQERRETVLVVAVPAAFHTARELPRHVDRASTAAGREPSGSTRATRPAQTLRVTPTPRQNTHRRRLRIRNVSSPTAREQVFFDRVIDLEVEASKEAWDREKYVEEQEEVEASGQAHPRETHVEEQVEIETSREAHLRSTESTEAAGAEEEPHNTVAGREAHCGACRVAMTVSPRFRGRTPSCVE